jgi:hypothetical protein
MFTDLFSKCHLSLSILSLVCHQLNAKRLRWWLHTDNNAGLCSTPLTVDPLESFFKVSDFSLPASSGFAVVDASLDADFESVSAVCSKESTNKLAHAPLEVAALSVGFSDQVFVALSITAHET